MCELRFRNGQQNLFQRQLCITVILTQEYVFLLLAVGVISPFLEQQQLITGKATEIKVYGEQVVHYGLLFVDREYSLHFIAVAASEKSYRLQS